MDICSIVEEKFIFERYREIIFVEKPNVDLFCKSKNERWNNRRRGRIKIKRSGKQTFFMKREKMELLFF